MPHCEVAKMVGQSNAGQPIALIATAGNNDGHHSHTDVGSFILHVNGESLICEMGRGRYSREYFRQSRYETPFTNSFGHSLPRIGGHLQSPGPEFGGHKQFYGTIVEHDFNAADKYITIDMHNAYDVPNLTLARRTLRLNATSGEVTLLDVFEFEDDPLEIEEALVTWSTVEVDGATARIIGTNAAIELTIQEPTTAIFEATLLNQVSHEHDKDRILTRLSIQLPRGTPRFHVHMQPLRR